MVLVGLALAGCPQAEALYGVVDTGEPPVTSDGTETDGETEGETEASGSGGTMGSDSGSSTGMADDGTTAGSDGATGTGTEGSTSLGEPEYGVPETTTG